MNNYEKYNTSNITYTNNHKSMIFNYHDKEKKHDITIEMI